VVRNGRKARHGCVAAAIIGSGAMLAACHTAPTPGPLIVAAPVCSDFTISIYFEANSAKVGHDAGALIDAAVKQAHGCAVTGVSVLGLSDAAGDPNANLVLSKHRAREVMKALARRGVTNVEFRLMAAGDTGAETKSGLAKPLRRRADVQFHLTERPPWKGGK